MGKQPTSPIIRKIGSWQICFVPADGTQLLGSVVLQPKTTQWVYCVKIKPNCDVHHRQGSRQADTRPWHTCAQDKGYLASSKST